MNSEWPVLPLGSLTVNYDGKRKPVKESERKAGPYPYYGASGVVDYVDGYIFDGSYLLIGEDGENLRTRQTPIAFMAHGKFWVNNHAHIVTGNHLADTRFLMYSILNADIHSYLTGAVMPKLTQGNLNKILLACPPIDVQRKIVSVLRALDDRIALLRDTNATLEAIAEALFKSWFVNFDPVRAKQEGQAPQGMDEATAKLFPDNFDETELGPVPIGWRLGKVGDIGEVICGKTPPTSDAKNYGADMPFITIPDMHSHLVVTHTKKSLSKLGVSTQPKKTIPPGAICVSCIATAGLVSRVVVPSQTNQQINSVIPSTTWGSSFSLFTLRRIGDAVRAGGSGGSVFHNLSKSGFEQLRVLFPTGSLASAFNDIIEPIVTKIIANQRHSESLSGLRDALLPRLISGDLRLSEGEELLQQAV